MKKVIRWQNLQLTLQSTERSFSCFFVSFVNALYAHTKRAAFYLDQVWFRIQMKVEQESCVRTMVASTMIEERIKVLLRKKR